MSMQSHIDSANLSAPSVRIQCKKHFLDAEYYSASLGKYVCFLCLVEEQGLNPISDKTKKYMTDFDAIRQMVMDCIKKNRGNTSIMYEWKETIRR